MNLKNFEAVVESKICNRGYSYYEHDAVEEIEQMERGEFSATVAGSEDYAVYIKLDKALNVLEHSCDCPYDWGNVCKHEVAVLYYIKKKQLYNQPIEAGTFHKIKQDLEKLTKKELIEMVLTLSKKNRTIREELKWELGYEEE